MGDLKYQELTEWSMRLPSITYDQSPFRPLQMSLSFHILTLEALCNMPAGLLVEMYEATAEKKLSAIGDEGPDCAAAIDEIAKTNDLVRDGMLSLYTHVVTYTYSMFETFAGDLWEMGVNLHPATLAELRGIRNRIEKGKSQQKRGDADKKKTVQLEEIKNVTGGSYALQGKMGTLLRECSESFTRLSGIREAYSAAFSVDSDSIDEILKRESIEILSAVRNTLVHKAGVADTEYVEFFRKHASAPPAIAGEKLNLNGGIIADLAGPVVSASVDLLKAVEEWMQRN